MKKIKDKGKGQIFTPKWLVGMMLNHCGYFGETIVGKHVIDNSCGNGAFLTEVLNRYISECLEIGKNKSEIKSDIETYIHGIELDKNAYSECRVNLQKISDGYGITEVNFDIINADALSVTKYNGKMDFVVGNPPYVRIHNITEIRDEAKSFRFASSGMTDLYIIFFELGFGMLNSKGKMCYVTPSSWLHSVAGTELRKYIHDNGTLKSVIDFGHEQLFEDATTYSLVSYFDNDKTDDKLVVYCHAGDRKNIRTVSMVSLQDIYIDKKIYLADNETIELLKCVDLCKADIFDVRNGFATLADDVFIGNVPDTKYNIKVVKASTGEWKRCFYPYDERGNRIPETEILSDSELAGYLEYNKVKLLARDIDSFDDWYCFGRTQAISDTYKNKIAINTTIKDINSIKITEVPAGCGVYSGLYILGDIDFRLIEEILKSDEFIKYVAALGNYKSGGYYSFNSKELRKYLNFKIFNLQDSRCNELVRGRICESLF